MMKAAIRAVFRRVPLLAQAGGWLLALPACGQSGAGQTGPSAAYAQLLRTLYHQSVPLIQPAELADLLARQPAAVLLLDTRTAAEFNVSHLAGARFVDYEQFEKNAFADLPREKPVVVYCTVGARSERVGERLKALGFKNVRNLYGGIFEWVNEGHPVRNAQGPTLNVHPYSVLWSPWLRRGNKVYE